jgi:2',3'-cyclic-nucleotide 2'-phosphodiesterase (5'-nucleotidase family)
MRVPNDTKMMAENDSDVLDIIFGGHDHHYAVELNRDTGIYMVKSGTDF